MKHTKFVVSSFENRNGNTSWRVDGYFNGVRIRKNFKTREEAAAEQTMLELKALNAANGLHTIATVLTAEQVREAEAVFHRLAGIRRRRGMAQTLSIAQVQALMDHFEAFEGGRWVPYFALCLFAGIRPGVPHGEITKLKADAVNLEAGIVYVSADVSKVREPRRVTIQPNLAAWLRA